MGMAMRGERGCGPGKDFGFAMCKMEPWKTLFHAFPFILLSFLNLGLWHNFPVLKVHPASKRKKFCVCLPCEFVIN